MAPKIKPPLFQLRDDIYAADRSAIKVLVNNPLFAQAFAHIAAENYPALSNEIWEDLLPYVEFNLNTLTELACWHSSTDPDQTRVGQILLEKFVSEEPNLEHQMLWVGMNLSNKYDFADPKDHASVTNRFLQACQHEQNRQQSERIYQEIQTPTVSKKSKI